MTSLSYKDFEKALGKKIDSKEVKQLFKKIKFKKSIKLKKDPEGGYEFDNQITLPKQGLVLDFNLPDDVKPTKDKEKLLVFKSVQFYRKDPKNDISHSYEGELPGSILFTDLPKNVHKKLGKPKSTKKAYKMEYWKFDGFNLAIQYTWEENGVRIIWLELP